MSQSVKRQNIRPQWQADLYVYFRSKSFVIQVVLLILVVIASLWSLMVGAVSIPVQVTINTLFDLDGDQQKYIILKSRLPRVVLALMTGGALAISGAIIQAIIRNPLASPKIIGVNSGAALFACLMIILLPDIPASYLPLAACAGGILAALIIFFATFGRNLSGVHLALVGIAVGFICESGVDYILVALPTHELATPLVWLTGSFWGRSWMHVYAVWLPLCTIAVLGVTMAYRLDILHLGAETATGLGLNVQVQRLVLLLIATLLASISVGVAGVLGFVGLMAPHIARRLVGGNHRLVLPASALVGMLLVVLADGAGRAMFPPIEISAGILTAIFGAPFFIYIMLTSSKE